MGCVSFFNAKTQRRQDAKEGNCLGRQLSLVLVKSDFHRAHGDTEAQSKPKRLFADALLRDLRDLRASVPSVKKWSAGMMALLCPLGILGGLASLRLGVNNRITRCFIDPRIDIDAAANRSYRDAFIGPQQEHPPVTTDTTKTAPAKLDVPLLDLKVQYAALKDEIMPVIEQVLDSQYMINGPAVGEFECAAAGYCDTQFAVGCSSGTDALILSMMALGLRPGDEVITTPFTFFATAGSIHRQGLKPVFVDIDPDTFNLDTELLEETVNEKTRAIMPVHLFGQLADMDTVLDVAEKHELKVIEDAAQAIGATQNDAPAGSLGDAGCFSFFPSKNLGGAGDGGLVTCRDEALYNRLLMLRNHGAHERYYHDEVGGNFRLDTLQAAYLSVKLKHLDAWHEGRRRNAAFYDEHLAEVDQVKTPVIAEGNGSIYNQYTLRVERRDELQAYLKEAGVGSAIYYPLCMHEQKCFSYLGYHKGDFPHAEQAAEEVLSIPIYPELSEEQLGHVVETIKRFYV